MVLGSFKVVSDRLKPLKNRGLIYQQIVDSSSVKPNSVGDESSYNIVAYTFKPTKIKFLQKSFLIGTYTLRFAFEHEKS